MHTKADAPRRNVHLGSATRKVAILSLACLSVMPGVRPAAAQNTLVFENATLPADFAAPVLPIDFGKSGDKFGYTVSIDGDTAVIGACRSKLKERVDGNQPSLSFPAYSFSGSAYVFTRPAGSGPTGVWTFQQELVPIGGPFSNDYFGFQVAISGDTILVSAQDTSDLTTRFQTGPGKAYVFVRSGKTWTQKCILSPSDPSDPLTYNPTFQDRITGLNTSGDLFSNRIAIEGDTAVISAPGHNHNGVGMHPSTTGAAYVFVRDANGDWTKQAELLAHSMLPDGSAVDPNSPVLVAGLDSVSISGDTIAIGGPILDSTSHNGTLLFNVGAVFVFERQPGGSIWTQTALLQSPQPFVAFDSLGVSSVAISGNTIVAGAFHRNADAGSALVFAKTGGSWAFEDELSPADLSGMSGTDLDEFGFFVDVDEASNRAVIGSPHHAHFGTHWSGAAYVFVRDANGAWSEKSELNALEGTASSEFGSGVALGADGTILVGASSAQQNNIGVHSGVVYAFDAKATCPADIEPNGSVDSADLATLLEEFGCTGMCPADINGDGMVDAADLSDLLGSWGPCP